ncbi:MAG: endonuclease domain-containing protein, partial [Rhodomicrobium sp.]
MSVKQPLTRPLSGHPLPQGERVSPRTAAMSRGKPSPLAGEGGDRQSRAPGEGEVTNSTPLSRARGLRHTMTDAEHGLWRILRNRQFARSKFRRQVPIGPYIADFLCFEARLIIEADGGQHADSARDAARDAWFATNGFRALRFWNNDILKNPEGVALVIATALAGEEPLTRPQSGHPLPQGERVSSPNPE